MLYSQSPPLAEKEWLTASSGRSARDPMWNEFFDIDADHGDRCVEFPRHGVLLALSAPCQLPVLAGPEPGRTIPLGDIALREALAIAWRRASE
jgi:hypothetical protein